MASDPPRSAKQRKADALELLDTERDVWVATASADGVPALVPLGFWWDGQTVTMVAGRSTVTVGNLEAGSDIRLACGTTRDVVAVDGTAELLAVADGGPRLERYVAKFTWSPHGADELWGEWVVLVVTPARIRVWREANEIAGRTVMRDGTWLV